MVRGVRAAPLDADWIKKVHQARRPLDGARRAAGGRSNASRLDLRPHQEGPQGGVQKVRQGHDLSSTRPSRTPPTAHRAQRLSYRACSNTGGHLRPMNHGGRASGRRGSAKGAGGRATRSASPRPSRLATPTGARPADRAALRSAQTRTWLREADRRPADPRSTSAPRS